MSGRSRKEHVAPHADQSRPKAVSPRSYLDIFDILAFFKMRSRSLLAGIVVGAIAGLVSWVLNPGSYQSEVFLDASAESVDPAVTSGTVNTLLANALKQNEGAQAFAESFVANLNETAAKEGPAQQSAKTALQIFANKFGGGQEAAEAAPQIAAGFAAYLNAKTVKALRESKIPRDAFLYHLESVEPARYRLSLRLGKAGATPGIVGATVAGLARLIETHDAAAPQAEEKTAADKSELQQKKAAELFHTAKTRYLNFRVKSEKERIKQSVAFYKLAHEVAMAGVKAGKQSNGADPFVLRDPSVETVDALEGRTLFRRIGTLRAEGVLSDKQAEEFIDRISELEAAKTTWQNEYDAPLKAYSAAAQTALNAQLRTVTPFADGSQSLPDVDVGLAQALIADAEDAHFDRPTSFWFLAFVMGAVAGLILAVFGVLAHEVLKRARVAMAVSRFAKT